MDIIIIIKTGQEAVGQDEKLGKELCGRRDEGSEMNPDQVQKRKSINVFMGMFSRKSKIHG